jgi:hypothetical protein
MLSSLMVLMLASVVSAPAKASPAAEAAPQGKSFGLGLVLGAPSGITGKYMLTGDQGIQASIGFGFSPRYRNNTNLVLVSDVVVAVDYLWTPIHLVDVEPIDVNLYIGGGAIVGVWENGFFGASVGARLPLGVSVPFKAIPLELYLELVPTLVVFPPLALGVGAGLGGRWYF